MRRVVVTGIGAVSPVGLTARETWEALVEGRSGIATITRFDASEFAIRIAGEVKQFSVDGAVGPKEARHMDLHTQFAVVAAREAVADAGLEITEANAASVGIMLGSAGGGIGKIVEQQDILLKRGPDRVSPLFLPHFLADSASGVLAITLGATGPNMAVVSACATGASAVGEAAETIRRGDADAMIAGGAEAPILPVIVAGFINMRALVNCNDAPARASRPFDRNRAGFVIAEGAGVLILESLDHALERGAHIYAEVAGYGSSNDAFHVAAPRENGAGAVQCMQRALQKAGLPPEAVDYINAHGTSTEINDKLETEAIKTVFGEGAYRVPISSTKSMTGHLLGAAGAVEALVCVKSIQTGWLHPTINRTDPDPECDLDYVVEGKRRTPVNVAISNSLGFGGHNATLVFRAFSA